MSTNPSQASGSRAAVHVFTTEPLNKIFTAIDQKADHAKAAIKRGILTPEDAISNMCLMIKAELTAFGENMGLAFRSQLPPPSPQAINRSPQPPAQPQRKICPVHGLATSHNHAQPQANIPRPSILVSKMVSNSAIIGPSGIMVAGAAPTVQRVIASNVPVALHNLQPSQKTASPPPPKKPAPQPAQATPPQPKPEDIEIIELTDSSDDDDDEPEPAQRPPEEPIFTPEAKDSDDVQFVFGDDIRRQDKASTLNDSVNKIVDLLDEEEEIEIVSPPETPQQSVKSVQSRPTVPSSSSSFQIPLNALINAKVQQALQKSREALQLQPPPSTVQMIDKLLYQGPNVPQNSRTTTTQKASTGPCAGTFWIFAPKPTNCDSTQPSQPTPPQKPTPSSVEPKAQTTPSIAQVSSVPPPPCDKSESIETSRPNDSAQSAKPYGTELRYSIHPGTCDDCELSDVDDPDYKVKPADYKMPEWAKTLGPDLEDSDDDGLIDEAELSDDEYDPSGSGGKKRKAKKAAPSKKKAKHLKVSSTISYTEEEARALLADYYRYQSDLVYSSIHVAKLNCTADPNCTRARDVQFEEDLNAHLRQVHNVEPFCCPIEECEEYSTRYDRDDLRMHCLLKHNTHHSWRCEPCANDYRLEKRCYTYSELSNHYLYEHQAGTFICPSSLCSFIASTRIEVFEHMREALHVAEDTPDQDYVKFSKRLGKFPVYSRNLAKSRPERPLPSPPVGQSKDEKQNQQTHSFACTVADCDRTFKSESQRDSHEKHFHTDEIYECHFKDCAFQTKYRSNLFTHWKAKHHVKSTDSVPAKYRKPKSVK